MFNQTIFIFLRALVSRVHVCDWVYLLWFQTVIYDLCKGLGIDIIVLMLINFKQIKCFILISCFHFYLYAKLIVYKYAAGRCGPLMCLLGNKLKHLWYDCCLMKNKIRFCVIFLLSINLIMWMCSHRG